MWRVIIVKYDLPIRELFTDSVLACDQLTLAASLGTFTELSITLTTSGLL